MSSYRRNKRLEKLEQQTTSSDVDIPISTWVKPIDQQQEICKQQDLNISPIKWEETEHE